MFWGLPVLGLRRLVIRLRWPLFPVVLLPLASLLMLLMPGVLVVVSTVTL
jgi:hypothetical protein